MFSIWFVGFLGVLIARTVQAGMHSKSLFYRLPNRYESSPVFEEDRVAGYAIKSFGMALIWPISLSALGFYKLGQRFSK